jgi:RimJ/RimL family protein N-acetyltransferase
MQLESKRLIIRDFTIEDADDLFELYKLGETSEFESWDPHSELNDSIGLTQYWVDSQTETTRTEFTLALCFEDRFIGLCGIDLGFGTETDDLRVGFLGYRIHPKFWNQGFATEASLRVIQFAFNDLELHRIHTGCTTTNLSSNRVLEKLGFRLEGTSKESFPIGNRWYDYNLYGMLNVEV